MGFSCALTFFKYPNNAKPKTLAAIRLDASNS